MGGSFHNHTENDKSLVDFQSDPKSDVKDESEFSSKKGRKQLNRI